MIVITIAPSHYFSGATRPAAGSGRSMFLDLTIRNGGVSPASPPRVLVFMRSYLDFEKSVAELETKVEELRAQFGGGDRRRSAKS